MSLSCDNVLMIVPLAMTLLDLSKYHCIVYVSLNFNKVQRQRTLPPASRWHFFILFTFIFPRHPSSSGLETIPTWKITNVQVQVLCCKSWVCKGVIFQLFLTFCRLFKWYQFYSYRPKSKGFMISIQQSPWSDPTVDSDKHQGRQQRRDRHACCETINIKKRLNGKWLQNMAAPKMLSIFKTK